MTQPKIKIKDTALLVIDVINSTCHPKCEIKKWNISFKKIRRVVPNILGFIKYYKESGGQVIYTNCSPWDKNNLAKNIIELYKDPKCKYYSKNKTGFTEEFFKIKLDKNDIIIVKNSYDAFTNLKLNTILKKKNIKYLVIIGFFGDGCVHATIQGGFSKGYNFIILKDLIETTDTKIRQKLQNLLKEYTWPVMFGKTINSNEFYKYIKV
ncbi:MAG: isochorismatase family cysteine hydrolase [Candidatus Woesearchaeota archaeon]